ncbi:hypothetical protein BH11MYX4_BH11MYX4_52080 [soil metagenome]
MHEPRLIVVLSLLVACGSTRTSGFDDDAGAAGDGGSGAFVGNDGGAGAEAEAGATSATTVYANTDDSLYSMDPATKKVALVGKLEGMGGAADDVNVTDCAVDATGVVWVNTPAVVYRAALPAGGTGAVKLTKFATIAARSKQRFYALAFAPAGVLGAGETLVGGDGDGELWSIDTTSGATIHLGGFGPDKTRVFALSGDLVFYTNAGGKPTGLATIRSCLPGGTSCTTTNDYLAGIDMTALATAFTSGTPAPSLLAGIYGGSGTSKGAGVGYGDLFGLGVWEGSVFAFQRGGAGKSPALLTIDTKSGSGSVIDASFGFTNGWSGAGVTTRVTVDVPPPPPPPR